MREITIPAHSDQLNYVTDFISEDLEREQCSARVNMQVCLAVEEIFLNIVNYAYRPKDGDATVRCSIGGDPLQIIIQFLDKGHPYNPLERKEPNLDLTAEEREIGGLGIFLVKKSMDSVEYVYQEGKNILTIIKRL